MDSWKAGAARRVKVSSAYSRSGIFCLASAAAQLGFRQAYPLVGSRPLPLRVSGIRLDDRWLDHVLWDFYRHRAIRLVDESNSTDHQHYIPGIKLRPTCNNLANLLIVKYSWLCVKFHVRSVNTYSSSIKRKKGSKIETKNRKKGK